LQTNLIRETMMSVVVEILW